MEKQTVRGLIQDLETDVAGVALRLETLNDINSLMGTLRVDMDNTEQGDIEYFFREHHRQVRVLHELIRHTVGDLNSTHQELYDRWKTLFNKTVVGEAE